MLNKVTFLIGVAVLFGLILSLPMMLLWNSCLVPAVSVFKEITWLQMWGIDIFIFGTLGRRLSIG